MSIPILVMTHEYVVLKCTLHVHGQDISYGITSCLVATRARHQLRDYKLPSGHTGKIYPATGFHSVQIFDSKHKTKTTDCLILGGMRAVDYIIIFRGLLF